MSPLTLTTEQKYEDAAHAYAKARVEEQRLEDERQGAKYHALLRVMQLPNEITQKAHSATSAADVVAMDPGYADHLKRSREAVLNTIVTKCEMDIMYARMISEANGGVK